jgi:hypothetical protein
MSEIQYRVELDSGSFANTVGPTQVVDQMYPEWREGSVATDSASATIIPDGVPVELRTFNSSLRFIEVDRDTVAILGNTKTGNCPVAESCGSCALAGSGLSIAEMAEKNCARANTAEVFQGIEQDARGSFVLLPLPNVDDSFVVNVANYTPEYNGNELMQNRLAAASSVVFTKSWMEQNEFEQISIAMNGADGSFGVAVAELGDETLIIPFCSMRGNMGDRPEEKQILRQAFDAYFASIGLDEEAKTRELERTQVSIHLSASASLANFAHKIQIPADGTDYANRLRTNFPDLIEQAGGSITPRIVLHEQYAGALERGHIFSQSDAWLGVQNDPYSPTACPMDGQTCHVDYRAETKYSLVKQLVEMGISEEGIRYSDECALDPSAPDNNMASNRREHNNGVETNTTNRTLNGMTIVLRDMQA